MKHIALLTIASLVLVLGAQPAVAVYDKTDNANLKNALRTFESDPITTAQQLKAIKNPIAKVFLAYLYFTKAIPSSNSSKTVDDLMNQAIAQTSDKDSLGEIVPTERYHYKDMEMLLRHLRFISDANDGAPIPTAVFRYYPVAAFKAFASYWGSNRDGWLSVEDYEKYDVRKIREVDQYVKVLEELCGAPSDMCSGSIRNAFYRKRVLGLMKASLGPTMFLPGVKGVSDLYDPDLADFMDVWSNAELWNKIKYIEYMTEKGRAQVALQKYYGKRLQLDEAKASECSKNAIEALAVAYLSQYSHSQMQETRDEKIYKICIKPRVTGAELEKLLTGTDLKPEELSKALRYCILNHADVTAIEWLISKGAPVSGGSEPPLFTAALRPEVISVLLKSGAQATESNAIKKTALVQAVQFDALDSVKLLHQAGAKITAPMAELDSPAAEEANSSCVYNYTVGGRTALHYAAMFASYPTIQYLLDNGADISARDSSGALAVSMIGQNKKLSQTEREKLASALQPKH